MSAPPSFRSRPACMEYRPSARFAAAHPSDGSGPRAGRGCDRPTMASLEERSLITGPKLEERPEQPYVAIRTQAAMHELPALTPQSHGEVRHWLERQDTEPAGPPFIRYLVIDM